MRIHLAWIRRSATAAIVVGASALSAAAQYAPYRPMPPQSATPVQPAAAQPAQPVQPATQTPYVPYWQQTPATTAQPTAPAPYYGQPATAQYPQTSAPYVPTAAAPTAAAPVSSGYPQQATQYPAYSSYPYVAYQSNQAAPAAPTEENMPAPSRNGAPANGHSAPMNGDYSSYSGSANCGCANGYPSTGCNGEACGTSYDRGYGLTQYFDNPCYDSQWFGGVYFLYMNRDRASVEKLTVSAADAAAYPYFPNPDITVLVNNDADFREGVEVRFGSTFSVGPACNSCDSCNSGCGGCNSCCPPNVYAWEVAWWGLDDNPTDVTYVDQPNYGLYGMKNFAGLYYDPDGAGAAPGAPVNGYYGYALPIPAASTEILAQRVRTNFKAQNFELNFIRFPMCSMGCGCNSGCGDCNSGCNSGYVGDHCGCQQECCSSAFSMYGLCGVRYFRTDDDFMYATEFIGTSGQTAYNGWSYDVANELFYDVQIENNLLGPQLGWNMNYCYCKWNFFMNSTFGVFANHIEQYQRMWSGGGGSVYFQGTGEEFVISNDKDDISFLGELRVGGSYDISCHWRGVLAYRAVAITGVATSTDNIPSDFSNSDWISIIDSDSSLVVHGVQVGAECRY